MKGPPERPVVPLPVSCEQTGWLPQGRCSLYAGLLDTGLRTLAFWTQVPSDTGRCRALVAVGARRCRLWMVREPAQSTDNHLTPNRRFSPDKSHGSLPRISRLSNRRVHRATAGVSLLRVMIASEKCASDNNSSHGVPGEGQSYGAAPLLLIDSRFTARGRRRAVAPPDAGALGFAWGELTRPTSTHGDVGGEDLLQHGLKVFPSKATKNG